MRITNTGDVSIGTQATYGKLLVYGDAVNFSPSADNGSNGIGACVLGTNVATATSSVARLYLTGNNAAHAGTLDLRSGSALGSTINMYNVAGTKSVYFNTDADSYFTGGNFSLGTTSVNYAGSGFTLSKDNGTTKWLVGPYAGAPTNFYVAAASSFGVYLAGTSATSWSSASDERLKNIIEPIEDGLQKVNTLRAVIGSYKADEAKTRRAFLIAQDLQNVLPEAVDRSNPDALGVQYTEVIPLLVVAIKELSAKNDALEARLAKLENVQ
jgi:hypothetical protein